MRPDMEAFFAWRIGVGSPGDAFRTHIEACDRCRREPFNLCRNGNVLLHATSEHPHLLEERSVVKEMFCRLTETVPRSQDDPEGSPRQCVDCGTEISPDGREVVDALGDGHPHTFARCVQRGPGSAKSFRAILALERVGALENEKATLQRQVSEANKNLASFATREAALQLELAKLHDAISEMKGPNEPE